MSTEPSVAERHGIEIKVPAWISRATTTEIEEVILQMSAFGGFPATWDALTVLRDNLATAVGDE